MNRTTLHLAALLAALPFAATPSFAAEKYPTKPIRLIVPYPPGGTTDLVARGIAVKLGEKYGQQVVIDNRGGASTIIGTDMMAKAAPDGYTFGLITQTTMSINPNVVPKLPYNTERDLAPITQVVYFPYVIAAHPSVPFSNMKEMIAQAKAKPGSITYGTPGTASTNHLGGAQLEQLIGAKLLHVPFKGAGPALTAALGGQVQMVITGLLQLLPYHQAGKLRILGVGHMQRVKAYPDIPAINESIPGYYNTGWWGIAGPAALPKPIIDKLSAIMIAGLAQPEVAQRFDRNGLEVASSTPQGLRDLIDSDLKLWRKIIKDAKISVDVLP
jgi:tripartite-type tricarboxylate transporter receptor subunit TctC